MTKNTSNPHENTSLLSGEKPAARSTIRLQSLLRGKKPAARSNVQVQSLLRGKCDHKRLLVPVLGCILIVATMYMLIRPYRRQAERQRVSAEAEAYLKPLVGIDESGRYGVTYPRNITEKDTFADLAKVMIPVWFEASLVALSTFNSTVQPADVHGARKCLLTTRDLLDVFSPVYTNSNRLWYRLRSQYKEGYELAGSFQDLHDGNVTYDEQLWHRRRQKLINWSVKFERYVRSRNFILYFLQLHYLTIIMEYDDVLSREHQLQYHNFRKEIRSFIDEYNLFDFVLFPQLDPDAAAAIDILKYSRTLLGEMNDQWETFNLYREENKEEAARSKLADAIDKDWSNFKSWCESNDLAGAIETLADE
eukprot:CAMPEP_0178666554 /NCGR_PEP_ID=MMETSP0698-20121128/30553_1 /TAXON_ID=265572 /ORGANISM="Extubocellulus spinifer, Strain CCMP396" /LENGTH=363 /DNA_ID=CAMNT_0020309951 /DNA_START=132 /DNA_END=1220 /DNA_ORIENTATION=-